MDSPQTITAVEWFFGYGGNHLGLKRVLPGLRLIAACEIEGYAIANMVAKMEGGGLDAAPIWSDCKTFPSEAFRGLVDIFIASYPCQPFSSAGKRGGEDDPRHLWPFVRRAVAAFQPRLCFFENVEGHVSCGLREVLTELVMLGYRVENERGEPTFGIFSATECGSPQRRRRVFILAARQDVEVGIGDGLCEQIERFNKEGFFNFTARTGELADSGFGTDGPEQREPQKEHAKELPRSVSLENTQGGGTQSISAGLRIKGQGKGNPNRPSKRLAIGDGQRARKQNDEANPVTASGQTRIIPGRRSYGIGDGLAVAKGVRHHRGVHHTPKGWQEQNGSVAKLRPLHWPGFVARPGQAQQAWEPERTLSTTFGGLGGGVNGRAPNVDRLRLLGNGVYPATAAKAFMTLYHRLTNQQGAKAAKA